MSLCRHCLGRFDARESYCRQLVGGLDILVSAVNDLWKLPSIWFSACVVGLGAHVVTVVGCSDCGRVQSCIPGQSASRGHYYTFARYEVHGEDVWWLHNDALRRCAHPSEISSFSVSTCPGTTYVLLYETCGLSQNVGASTHG